MRIIKGNLFTSEAKAIGHGVNCKGAMGAGIAKLFRQEFPEMYEEYREICLRGELQPGEVFTWWDERKNVWVYNIASQNNLGADARLEWFEEAAFSALAHADLNGVEEVAIPQIGCGIGGLDFSDVEPMLEKVERSFASSFVVYVF